MFFCPSDGTLTHLPALAKILVSGFSMMLHEWLTPHTNPLNSVLVKGVKFLKCQPEGANYEMLLPFRHSLYLLFNMRTFRVCSSMYMRTDSEMLLFLLFVSELGCARFCLVIVFW